MREDLELRQFRELLPPPDHWEDGFGLKSIVGAIFVGIIMTPASMYMGLVIGSEIGQAAQWVTIILFMEVARRAFTTLKRPEIYLLYYMAGASHAGWKKLRRPRMSGDDGATHAGILSARPRERNASLCTMNWFHSSPEPVTRLAPAM